MALRDEIVSSIYGAWRIARFDPDAMRYFNLSFEGFWRSFLAAFIVAPFFLMATFATRNVAQAPADVVTDEPLVGYLLMRLVVFAVSWAAFPIVMIPVAQLLNLSQTYVPYIIAWNWSSVVASAVLLPASFLIGFDVVPDQAAGMVFMIVYVTVLFYGYLVTRTALGCTALVAVGVVILDFLLNMVISAGFERLVYSPGVSG